MCAIKDKFIDGAVDDTDYGYKIVAPKCAECSNSLFTRVSRQRGYCVHCAKKKVVIFNPNRINYPDVGYSEMNQYLGLAK